MLFTDRSHAGRELAQQLLRYKSDDVIVLALPRGGVPIGFEIAKVLDCPLDVLVVRKLGAPSNAEFGIGAIAPKGVRVLDEQVIEYLGLTHSQIETIEQKGRTELERWVREYRGHDAIPTVANKTVILVDDGLATGVTMRAAIQAVLSQEPRKLVVAIPVCAQDSIEGLRSLIRISVDTVECLSTPNDLIAVGNWYKNFPQVSDEEVKQLLSQSRSQGKN